MRRRNIVEGHNDMTGKAWAQMHAGEAMKVQQASKTHGRKQRQDTKPGGRRLRPKLEG